MSDIPTYWRVPEWYPDLPATSQEKLKKYQQELLRFNSTLNLVSPKTIPFADGIHFADSILAMKLILNKEKLSIVHDIGSGNGFPGIILAILAPEVKVVAVERDTRKSEFLKHVATTLGLKNFEVRNVSLEAIQEKSIQVAITRGFANISKTILLTRRIISKGGKIYHMKSEEWATEVGAIPTQLCSHWTPSLVGSYKLPIGEVSFSVVVTEKITD